MDLKDQLKDLFPDHKVPESTSDNEDNGGIWLQDEPLYCHFEKRKGKVNTIIKGYTGAKKDFKELAKIFKTELGVGGSVKNEEIIIQGNFREKIIEILEDLGFQTKKVGG